MFLPITQEGAIMQPDSRPDNRGKTVLDKDDPRFSIIGFHEPLKLEELNDHIVFVKQLVVSKTPDDLKKRLLSIFNKLGFSDFSFLGFTHNYKPHVFLTTLPEKLLADYEAKKLYTRDMTLDYLKASNPTHIHHSDIQKIIDNPCIPTHTFNKNREILALYKEFGFNDAYLMPYKTDEELFALEKADEEEANEVVVDKEEIKSKEQIKKAARNRKGRMLFSLMAKGATAEEFKALTESRGAVLHGLGDTAVRVFKNKFISKNPAPKINPKALKLITVMAKFDVTLGQAAEKLCVSTDTANKYMAMAKEMLGSRSQANTVYKAIQRGLIDFD